jgi:hypothetical protein
MIKEIAMKHRIVVILFLCCCGTSLFAQPTPVQPSGGGTSSNPYLVATFANLYWISQNSGYWGKYYVQTADIAADSSASWTDTTGFTPIGNSSTKFTGTYKGRGHNITGLTIRRSSTTYVGMFGYTSGATIDSLGLVKAYVRGYQYVGALVGYEYTSSTISNCYTTGTVIGDYSYNGGIAGGIISSTAKNSYSFCAVTSKGYNAGGFCGYGYSATITNCYASGMELSTYLASSVAAFIAYSYSGSISNCFYNKTTSTSYGDSYATGKTAVQMDSVSIFTSAGWDFAGETANGTANLWARCDSINSGSPCLAWQGSLTDAVVTTSDPDNVTANTAKVGGTLSSIGFPNPSYGVCWNTKGSPTLADSSARIGLGGDTIAFSKTLSNLALGTTYYARAYAINAAKTADTIYGNVVTFTTLSAATPNVLSFSLNSITSSSATFKAALIPNTDTATVYLQYGTTSASETTIMIATGLTGSTVDSVSYTLSGLTPTTVYYARLYAVNSVGTTSMDSVKCFTTSTGSGTTGDPYVIASLSDLNWLSQNSGYWGKVFRQTADIAADSSRNWNSGAGFSPIGNNTTKFTGTYHGGSHMITKLYMNRSSSSYVGLFGFVSGGTIDSLGVNADTVDGQTYTGILAGYNTGTITKCFTTGSVVGTSISTGGFIGYNSGGTITYSYSTSAVNGVNDIGAFIGDNVGGTVKYCYATGKTAGGTTSSNYTSGGLIGYNTGSVNNCYASGTVTGYDHVAGLIGSNGGTVSYCYAVGTVSGTTNTGSLLGTNAGTYTYSFYNSDINGTSSIGVSRTTSQMKQLSTFTAYGWDFAGETANGTANIWARTDSISSGYPCFVWQGSLTPGVISAMSADSIGDTSAVIHAKISSIGFPNPAYGVCWNTTGSPGFSDNKKTIDVASDTVSFSAAITGLNSATTYYVRPFAINAVSTADTVYGNVISFTTTATTPPSVKTLAASGMTGGTAVLNATINPHSNTTAVYVAYGTSACTAVVKVMDTLSGNGATTMSYTVGGLSPLTKYYYKFFASNVYGTTCGDSVSFTTTVTGSGTSSDPFQVASLSDLSWITADSTRWNSYYIQTTDIDASSLSSWTTIGSATCRFNGQYNGNGHRIAHLTIGSSSNYQGLFGTIGTSGVVKSLTFDTCRFSAVNYVGIIAGYSRGYIANCIVNSGSVKGTNYIGGLVGFCDTSATMYRCSNSSSDTSSSRYIGGITAVVSVATISQCFNSGAVVCNTSSGGADAGGIAGTAINATSTIINCYNSGTVKASSGNSAAGILGSAKGSVVSYCYNTATITASTQSGGIAGYCGNTNVFTSCFSTYSPVYNNAPSTATKVQVRTSAQMKLDTTYTNAGWDFSDETANGSSEVWSMSGIFNSGYPCLTWQGTLTPATVATVSEGSVADSTAVISGRINSIGFPNPRYGICWNTSGSPTCSDSKKAVGTATDTVSFSTTLTGLTSHTTYYARSYAINTTTSSDTVYGNTISFLTPVSHSPSVQTVAASGITNTSATLNATVNGYYNATSVYFAYGTSECSTIMKISDTLTSGTAVSVSCPLSGLSPATRYFFKVCASDAYGTAYGDSLSFTTAYFTGSGTSEEPYQIGTFADLKYLSDSTSYWNKSFVQTSDIDASTTATMNGGAGFSPIGTGSTAFSGAYHGRGHLIKNFVIARSSNNIGIFGRCSGTIDSLGLVHCSIMGGANTGGMIGYNQNGSLSTVYVTGTVIGSGTVGGLVGNNANGTISNAYSTAVVSGTDTIGGLIGTNTGSLSLCYASGRVHGTTHIGGLTGTNSGMVATSYWDTIASGQSSGCGGNSGTFDGLSKSTAALKHQSTFSGWDFTSIWTLCDDSTSPGLRGLDNAPFAFTDTIIAPSTTVSLAGMLSNDYDIETGRKNLILKVMSATLGTTDSTTVLTVPALTNAGRIDTVVYRVGEVRSSGDTLWGASATSLVVSPALSLMSLNTVLNFGNTVKGTSITDTIRIINTTPLQAVTIGSVTTNSSVFTAAKNISSITSDTLKIAVTFTPTAFGTFTDTVFVGNSTSTSLLAIPVSGASPNPAISAWVGTLAFSNTVKGDSSSLKFFVKNSSMNAATICSTQTSSTVFTAKADTSVVRAADSTGIVVKFTPTAFGAFSDTVKIVSDGGTLSIALSGSSPSPSLVLSQRTAVFGRVGIDDSSSITITITNSSVNTLAISSLAAGSSSFKAVCLKAQITRSDTACIVVTFKPVAFGSFADTVKIVNNSDTSVVSIPLSGTSPYPAIRLSRDDISFGLVTIDSSVQASVRITDTSVSALTIDSVWTGTKYFSLSTYLKSSRIHSGDTVVVTCAFTPDSIGKFNDTLYIANTSQASLLRIPLSGTGTDVVVSVAKGTDIPKVFALNQNYPNPFNPSTTISFTLAKDGFTTLKIYDMLGREVATLVNGDRKAGVINTVTFNASKLASGVYFSRLVSNGSVQVKKLILMK